MEEIFMASTREEANQEADKWWAEQMGLRLVQRTEVAVGQGPSLDEADHWRVTIHYEPESSN
jgi:hypothetical protein